MANVDMDALLRPPRVMVAAMMLGVLAFGVITLTVLDAAMARPQADAIPVLLAVLAVTALAMFPVHMAIRRGMAGAARRAWDGRSDDDAAVTQLASRFVQLTIIGAAQAEGISLFGLVVYLVTGVQWTLVVPVLGLLLLAVLFPTRDRFRAFAARVTGTPCDDLVG